MMSLRIRRRRSLVALTCISLLGCGSDSPFAPTAVTQLSGTYAVSLRSGGGPNPAVSCPSISVTLGASPSWTLLQPCATWPGGGTVHPGTAYLRGDTLVLESAETHFGSGTPYFIKLYDAERRGDLVRSSWDSDITCKQTSPSLCVREYGSAEWTAS